MIHLVDRAQSEIRFVVQIETNVGRSKAQSNISFNLHNNKISGKDLSNNCFIVPEALNNLREKSTSYGQNNVVVQMSNILKVNCMLGL